MRLPLMIASLRDRIASSVTALKKFPGLKRNIGANIYGQVVTVVAQLALVPVLLLSWGLDGFGQWMLLSTIPALLTYGDFGLGTVAGNVVGRADARGEHQLSANAFTTGHVSSIAVAAILSIAAVPVLLLLANSELSKALPEQHYRSTALFLVAAAGASIVSGFYTSVLRGVGRWASATVWNNSLRLIESAAVALVAWRGGSIMFAAGIVLLVRLITCYCLARLIGSCSFRRLGARGIFESALAKSWIRPAITFCIMPIAQALMLNIPVVLIGRSLGSEAVAAFVAARTLSRIPLQLSNVVGTAVAGPALREAATGDRRVVVGRIRHVSDAVTIASLAVACVLLAAAPRIFEVWTHGVMRSEQDLLAALLAGAVGAAAWNVPSNYLAALNEHERFYLQYLCLTVAGCLAIVFVSKWVAMVAAVLVVVEILSALLVRRELSLAGRYEH